MIIIIIIVVVEKIKESFEQEETSMEMANNCMKKIQTTLAIILVQNIPSYYFIPTYY